MRDDRRRGARLSMLHSRYRGSIDNVPVEIIDLSVSGAQIATSIPVRSGDSIIFRISLADEPPELALGRVRWVQQEEHVEDQQEPTYRVGIGFETWDVRVLKGIVDSCRWDSTVR